MSLSSIERRLLAEDLVRLRRPEEQRGMPTIPRFGRIDANPHQIDAVVFALGRIPEGGCILADEVGLGKTIEAGLIISQCLADGLSRVLLVVPKALVGQWQSQMYELFGIVVRQGVLDPEAFAGPGVFLTHRELAGGTRGASVLKAVEPFDLVVVDEAHELFAGLYKRYGKDGAYAEASPHAQIAGRLREVAQRGPSPVILLTATPLQNSLAELWGLVQYVEPSGTLLGTLPAFRELFCEAGDRRVQPDQAEELKRRLGTVLQRTLRRDAQLFLEIPFVERRARLFDVTRSSEERALHHDVSAWLMGPDLVAFDRRYRHLLSIAFQRRMASSLAALAESLDKVAARLEARIVGRGGDSGPDSGRALLAALGEGLDDLEALARQTEDGTGEDAVEDGEPAPGADMQAAEPSPTTDTAACLISGTARLEAELARVQGFVARARALGHDAKAARLLDVLRLVDERGRDRTGSGKAVMFTEALATAVYVRNLLLARGYAPEDVALFQGDNETPEAVAALARWEAEVGYALSAERRPQRDVALRLAIVHAFQTRARVLVSTEAGAKGLNLQFCDTVINFDLPWNPQRIEQRIGRVHRYGQRRGVTVVGFIAKDDEVQALTLELLTRKLDLFGTVLGASDQVLHTPSGAAPETLALTVGGDFEREMRAIYARARSQEEVAAELRALRDAFDVRRRDYSEQQARASTLIDARLGEAVRGVLGDVKAALGAALGARDRDVERLVRALLDELGVPVTREEAPGRVVLRIGPSAALSSGLDRGLTAIVGDPRDVPGEPLHVGHALVRAAVARAREVTARPLSARLIVPASGEGALLAPLVGRRGRLVATMVAHRGIERVDSLLRTAVVEVPEGPHLLSEEELAALVRLRAVDVVERDDADAVATIDPDMERALVADQARISALGQARFAKLMGQLEDYRRDQILLVERRLAQTLAQLDELEKRRKTAGAQGLGELERRIAYAEQEAKDHDAAIARLENEGDEKLILWRERLLARRFVRPATTPVLNVAFTLVAEGDVAC
jgi:superfamily II DNA or RNA helicase